MSSSFYWEERVLSWKSRTVQLNCCNECLSVINVGGKRNSLLKVSYFLCYNKVTSVLWEVKYGSLCFSGSKCININLIVHYASQSFPYYSFLKDTKVVFDIWLLFKKYIHDYTTSISVWVIRKGPVHFYRYETLRAFAGLVKMLTCVWQESWKAAGENFSSDPGKRQLSTIAVTKGIKILIK